MSHIYLILLGTGNFVYTHQLVFKWGKDLQEPEGIAHTHTCTVTELDTALYNLHSFTNNQFLKSWLEMGTNYWFGSLVQFIPWPNSWSMVLCPAPANGHPTEQQHPEEAGQWCQVDICWKRWGSKLQISCSATKWTALNQQFVPISNPKCKLYCANK